MTVSVVIFINPRNININSTIMLHNISIWFASFSDRGNLKNRTLLGFSILRRDLGSVSGSDPLMLCFPDALLEPEQMPHPKKPRSHCATNRKSGFVLHTNTTIREVLVSICVCYNT